MIKKLSLIAAMVGLMAFSNMANAAEITFEEVDASAGPFALNSTHYPGINWNGFSVMQPSSFNPRYLPGLVSQDQLAWNDFGDSASITFDNPVNFISGYFTAPIFTPTFPAYVPVEISISGLYADGSTFSFDDYIVLATEGSQQFVNFNLNGITSITFSPDVSTTPTAHNWFAMDNITYTPVPEPGSMALGLISLAGLIGSRIRRK